MFLLFARRDSGFETREVPNDKLATDATTYEHVGVLWVEFYGTYFYWSLKDIVQSNNVSI